MAEQPSPFELPDLLSEEEARKLIYLLATTRGEAGFSEEEAAKILSWANMVKFETAMLSAALQGQVLLNVKNSDLGDMDDVTYIHARRHLGKNFESFLAEFVRCAELRPPDTTPTIDSANRDLFGEV